MSERELLLEKLKFQKNLERLKRFDDFKFIITSHSSEVRFKLKNGEWAGCNFKPNDDIGWICNVICDWLDGNYSRPPRECFHIKKDFYYWRGVIIQGNMPYEISIPVKLHWNHAKKKKIAEFLVNSKHAEKGQHTGTSIQLYIPDTMINDLDTMMLKEVLK